MNPLTPIRNGRANIVMADFGKRDLSAIDGVREFLKEKAHEKLLDCRKCQI